MISIYSRIRNHQFKFFAIFLLFAAVFITYSNVYDFTFLYDDEFFIVKNEHLNSMSSVKDIFTSSSTAGSGFKDSFYRPVQFFLYLLVKSAFGMETWAFHLLNLLIHFGNAVLLFFLALKFRFSKPAALMLSLLWCVHPIHVECVAYMSATADSLHTFFLMLGLNFLLPKPTRVTYALGVLSFMLAILSKETAVLGAVLYTSTVFYCESDRWNWRVYLKTLPFWTMSLTYAILRKTILNFDGDFSFYKQSNIYTESILNRVYTFFATLPKYIEVLFWPRNLHIDRKFPVYIDFAFAPVIIGAALCTLAALILLYTLYSRRPSWVFASFVILWFASLHILHSGVILPLNSLFLEHWMYMPSMALFFAIGAILEWMWRRKSLQYIAIIAVGALTLVMGHLSHAQNRVWASPISLFSHILSLNPDVARARHGLAMAYSDLGENSKALELYEQALTQQVYPATYHNMGILYIKQERLDKAEEHFLKAIELDPHFHPSYSYLIQIYQVTGKPEKAQEYENRLRAFTPAK